MFCFSNNGYSMRAVYNDYIVQDGEVLFADYATIEQLNEAFPLYNNGVPILSLDEQISLIEEKYKLKFDSIEKRLTVVFLSDGIDQEVKTIILQNEYKDLSDQKDLEILKLFGGVE